MDVDDTLEHTRIFLVEDEPLFRDFLRRTLSNRPGFTIVGEAEDGWTAIRMVKLTKPDVLLLDIELSGKLDGVDVAMHVKKANPKIAIVILSSHSDPRYASSLPLRGTGGWAYLLKQAVPSVDILVDAIEKAKQGSVVLDPQISNNLRVPASSPFSRLSFSRIDVMKLIAQGYNNAAIAHQLNLSVKTVENYINDIYHELGLKEQGAASEVNARVKATLMFLQDGSI